MAEFWAPLRARRKEVMVKPDPFDFIELQIRAYVEQNLEWVRIWQRSYPAGRVAHERVRRRSGERAPTGPTLLQSHQDWLAARSETGVPFRREAEEFAQIYHANKARYGNVHLSKAASEVTANPPPATLLVRSLTRFGRTGRGLPRPDSRARLRRAPESGRPGYGRPTRPPAPAARRPGPARGR